MTTFRWMGRALGAGALALVIAGCGPTDYEPAGGFLDETGYETTKVAEDRYLVSFEGNAATSRQRVESLMLLRAAEVAAETGPPYIALIEDDTQREIS